MCVEEPPRPDDTKLQLRSQMEIKSGAELTDAVITRADKDQEDCARSAFQGAKNATQTPKKLRLWSPEESA